MVKNPPANAGCMSLTPGGEDPTCCRATKPRCYNYWAIRGNYWRPHAQSLCSTREDATRRRQARQQRGAATPANAGAEAQRGQIQINKEKINYLYTISPFFWAIKLDKTIKIKTFKPGVVVFQDNSRSPDTQLCGIFFSPQRLSNDHILYD